MLFVTGTEQLGAGSGGAAYPWSPSAAAAAAAGSAAAAAAAAHAAAAVADPFTSSYNYSNLYGGYNVSPYYRYM